MKVKAVPINTSSNPFYVLVTEENNVVHYAPNNWKTKGGAERWATKHGYKLKSPTKRKATKAAASTRKTTAATVAKKCPAKKPTTAKTTAPKPIRKATAHRPAIKITRKTTRKR